MPEPDASPIALVIIGAGGFGREVLQYVKDAIARAPHIRLKGFLDDDVKSQQNLPPDMPYLGPIQAYRLQAEDRLVVAIGDPTIRAQVIRAMEGHGAQFFTVRHPTAHIAATATIGKGCIIAPFCAVGNQARLENHVVMTWFSSVAHDSIAEDFTVLSPHSTVNGGCVLEEGAFLGTHAVVNPLQRIGAWAKVGAGSVVYRSVEAHHLALGNPAKARPMLRTDRSSLDAATDE